MFINAHTHHQLHDATLELVNLDHIGKERPPYYSFGLHPWHVGETDNQDILRELENTVNETNCLAVGECGLDKLSKASLELQAEFFSRQIEIANKAGKPLIIHCVKAFSELLNCLGLADNKVPVIVHGFNNNENIARLLNDEGCYFSFGKALLGYDSNAAKALKSVGRRKFFLETDDADVSIKHIYHKAAEILGIDTEILQTQLLANFEQVFKIKL